MKTFLRNTVPIIVWIPKYNLQNALGDLIAGITVGLTLIPQSIAYAALAGLAPQYGLYSSMLGGVIYACFGTVPAINIAPSALLSLLTFTYTSNLSYSNLQGAILLAFLAGLVELLCGVLQLGFLINFVSAPVVAAFTSAGALTIAASQLKSLFGLKFKAETFADNFYNFVLNVKHATLGDSLLSLFCCIFLLLMNELKGFGTPPNFNSKNSSEKGSSWKTFLWFLSVGRNALLVIVCTIISFVLDEYDYVPFKLTGSVPQGLPSVTLPFVIENNSTDAKINFIDAVTELKGGIVIIPFVAILANVAIGKSFFKGRQLNASQEMRALGLCNLVGSFFGSYPVNAAFSRASVNNASGVRTVFGGIYAAILVLLALTFLTPYFYFIPKATLASVIFCAVLNMIEVRLCLSVWKYSKIASIPMIVTLIACLLLNIEIGIILGIITDLIFLLYFTSKPKINIDVVQFSVDNNFIRATLKDPSCYVSAEYLQQQIIKRVYENNLNFVVLDCEDVTRIDFTTAKCFDVLIKDTSKRDIKVCFFKLKDSLEKILKRYLSSSVIFIKTDEDLNNYLSGKFLKMSEGNDYLNQAFLEDENKLEINMVSNGLPPL